MKSFLTWTVWVIVLLGLGIMASQLESRENPVVPPAAAPGLQHVSIHFQGSNDLLDGYVDVAHISVLNGGVSLTAVYDRSGHLTSYINYGRVDRLLVLPD